MLRTLLALVAAVSQLPSPVPRDTRTAAGAASAAISGRITDQSGRPIQRAIATLAPIGEPSSREWLHAFADADGRYEFTRLEPGEYFISAGPPDLRATHLRQAFGEPAPMDPVDRPAPNLTLKAGEVRTNVDVELARAFAIEGRVLDENNEPMAEVGLELRRASGMSYPTPHTQSDDRGEFRFFGLPPGRYHVCANPGGRSIDATADNLRYVRTCHLASTGISAAADIVLTTEDAVGIDVRVQRSRTYSVSGSVIDASGMPVDGAFVSAIGSEEDRSAHGTSAQGRFVLNGVVTGRYIVLSSIGGPRDPGDSRPPVREREMGHTLVDVGGDLSGIIVNLSKPQTISGRVVVERSARRLPKAAGMVVQTGRPQEWSRVLSRGPFSAVGDNLKFELTGIYHDPLIVGIYGLPEGWVAKSVRYGGVDITDRPVGLAAESRPRELEIMVTDRVARPIVRMIDADGTPSRRAHVVILPADPARRKVPRFGPSQTPDRDGRLKLGAIAPGEYLLIAMTSADHAALMQETGRVESLAPFARRVTFVEEEARVFDVPIVALPSRQ